MRFSVAFVTLAAAGACTPAFAAPGAAASGLSRRTFTEDLFHGLILDGLPPPPSTRGADKRDGFEDFLEKFFKEHPNDIFARDVESSGDIGEILAQMLTSHPNQAIARGLKDTLAALKQALQGSVPLPSKRDFSDVVNFLKDHVEVLALRDVEKRG
ncbi:hypothetical protein FA95DRAFT_1600648, partial [Auriscalpium vulgare]